MSNESHLQYMTDVEIDAEREKTIKTYGTLEELRRKDRMGIISAEEVSAMNLLDGLDFIQHGA